LATARSRGASMRSTKGKADMTVLYKNRRCVNTTLTWTFAMSLSSAIVPFRPSGPAANQEAPDRFFQVCSMTAWSSSLGSSSLGSWSSSLGSWSSSLGSRCKPSAFSLGFEVPHSVWVPAICADRHHHYEHQAMFTKGKRTACAWTFICFTRRGRWWRSIRSAVATWYQKHTARPGNPDATLRPTTGSRAC